MSQPVWKLVYATDYSALYRDETGVYPEELAVVQTDDDRDEDDPDRHHVYRFAVERCAIVRLDDNGDVTDDPTVRGYLVHASLVGRTDLPHAWSRYEEWFAKDLASVARSIGSSRADLIAALCSEDAPTRACAYEAIGGYHGFANFDQYPDTWSESNFAAWPDKGPDVAPSDDTDDSTSADADGAA
jgi:hypothetical protein